MQAAAVTAGRAIRRRCAIGGSLISLVAGLCALVPAPQAALAASQGATSISAGGEYSCVLVSGKAYCWGYNGYGQLGDAEKPANSGVPVAVSTRGALADKTVTQISAGYYTECALGSTGAAYCWGLNINGELGDGSNSGSGVPVAVSTSGALAGKTLTQISAGEFNACALDNTGAAFCWGGMPAAVDTSGALAGKTLTQISAGAGDTCALDSTGAAYCWGGNAFGQLGDGSTTSSSVPVAVDTSGALAGKTLTQISAGTNENTCALDSAGAAYCWGWNAFGQLGDGSTTSSSVPVAVDTSGALAGKTLTQVSAGGINACALDSNGAAYCWGDNSAGELGDDSAAIQSNVPVLVAPQAPANVTAHPGNTIATVSWTAPAFLNTGTLTGYTATASPGGAMCTTPAGTTACTITGLANGTTYHVTVAVHTTVGSGASTPAIVTPEPGVGTGPITSGYHQAKCLDDSNDSSVNDTPVVIGECNGSPDQNWTVKADGTIHINGKCMDIYRDEKSSKTPVELWTCTGGTSQQWQWTGGTLVNAISGKCLDDPRFNTADGTQLEIYTCNGGVNQQWRLP